MYKRMLTILLSIVFLFLVAFQLSFADGFIVPKPRPELPNPADLSVKYHRVDIKVRDQASTTEIDQVFINENKWDLEGTYIFPLPENSAISEFAMDVDGKMVNGKILDKDKARQIYEDIVRQKKDPAILEYLGRNIFQARVYPIPARGEKRIKIKYNELLKLDQGMAKIVYPLSTEKFSSKPLQEVTITINIHSSVPIKAVYSPTHSLAIHRIDDYNVKASFEKSNVKPDKDLVVYYTLSKKDFGVNLITFRDNPKEMGYFLLLIAPKEKFSEREVLAKEVIFVLDTSGSMSDGNKISYAKKALNFCLANLGKEDYFNLINFSDDIDLFSPEMLTANSGNLNKAKDFVQRLQPTGGTNINEALLKALSMFTKSDRPKYIIFLTDGLPTVGITSEKSILENVAKKNKNIHLFAFGVGDDVNTILLDQLGSRNHGVSEYVKPGEETEQKLSSFYRKISRPVLSNIKLDFTGINASMLYPKEISDLFSGTQLVMLGRYEGSGEAKIKLSGKRGDALESFEYTANFSKFNRENDYIARLWATRRIGYLLETLRVNGENKELINEIIRLSKEYGIITPYTSFLVEEGDINKAQEGKSLRTYTKSAPSGAGAVKASKNVQVMKEQANLDSPESPEKTKVKTAGGKTFYLKGGIWTESTYKGEKTIKIKFASSQYFNLLKENAELGKILSIGKEVIINLNGTFYKIY